MSVIVGSMSEHKLGAVREALRRIGYSHIGVTGCHTESGVNAQPVGMEETTTGAMNRAYAARAAVPSGVLWVGIESGIFRAPPHSLTLDLAVIAFVPSTGDALLSTSTGITFPEEYVNEAERRGFRHVTVGHVIAERLGGDGTDPHSVLTGGRTSRNETLVTGIIVAFTQSKIRF